MTAKLIVKSALVLVAGLCLHGLAIAQMPSTQSPTAVAPGSSLPGLGPLALGLNGPGYIEIGGGHSALSAGQRDWTDFYGRAVLSGGRNTFTGELFRQARFGDTGWFGDLGLTRTLSENWYAQFSAGASAGGFFLPRYRTDLHLSRKFLRKRQLVATVGGGFDQSRTVNRDIRGQLEMAYYFDFPVVLQGGVMQTYSTPGQILARTSYIAVSQGHQKEHFVSLRYDWGREGYEVIGPPSTVAPANVLFFFPIRTATGTWRQWIGPNWGFNLNLEAHQEPVYHRLGGTFGVFLDF